MDSNVFRRLVTDQEQKEVSARGDQETETGSSRVSRTFNMRDTREG